MANEASRIETITIGPDQKHFFDDDLHGTGCGDNYYYAVRAFDANGNPSGVRAEEFEVIIEEEKIIEVFEEQPAPSGGTAGGIAPIPAEGEGAEVAGEETIEGEGGKGEENPTVGEEAAQIGEEIVLGEETAAKVSDALKNWKLWLLILILGGIGWWIYAKNRKKSPTEDLEKKDSQQ